jgi:hypothetical protein
MKNDKVMASQSFKTALMAAMLPHTERGVGRGQSPPLNEKLRKFKI